VKRWFRGPWLWVVLFAIVILVVLDVVSSKGGYTSVDTSTMVHEIKAHNVKDVVFIDGDQTIEATKVSDGQKISSQWLADQGIKLVDLVQKESDQAANTKNAFTYTVKVPQPSIIWTFISNILPFILLVVIFFFLMNSMQGGGGRVMQFAKSKAKMVSKDTPKTSFSDVAGVEEAIE
jgi:cell division protease FtsH